MLHIESVNAETFRMYGNEGVTKSDFYPKEYQASAIRVPNETEPRISIKHLNLGDKIVNLRKVDEIELNSVVLTTAEAFVSAFNSMIANYDLI